MVLKRTFELKSVRHLGSLLLLRLLWCLCLLGALGFFGDLEAAFLAWQQPSLALAAAAFFGVLAFLAWLGPSWQRFSWLQASWRHAFLGVLAFLGAFAFLGLAALGLAAFFAASLTSPSLKDPEATGALGLLNGSTLDASLEGQFQVGVDGTDVIPAYVVGWMYFRIACLEEPDLSLSEAPSAAAIISSYLG
ncbi:hypothetical protein DPMN_003379 [Dreissena polymorpha]|uniref:Uncharacterized protein n=1 Tax=Dreissena polymorpha TaxID=45954 RepID=A0A9D4MPT2_DREPO|nr:hypothetical protein DPMN_003379 [Dreissena polymorpha]